MKPTYDDLVALLRDWSQVGSELTYSDMEDMPLKECLWCSECGDPVPHIETCTLRDVHERTESVLSRIPGGAPQGEGGGSCG